MYKSYDPFHRRSSNHDQNTPQNEKGSYRTHSLTSTGAPERGYDQTTSTTSASYDPFSSRSHPGQPDSDERSAARHHRQSSKSASQGPPFDLRTSVVERAKPVNTADRQETRSSADPSPSSGPGPAPPRSRQRPKTQVQSACANCKKDHLSCDTSRPCRRCVSTNKQATCVGVEPKKRGRPKLSGDAAMAASSRASKRKRERQPSRGNEGEVLAPEQYSAQGSHASARDAHPASYPPSSYQQLQLRPSTSNDYSYSSAMSTPSMQPYEQQQPPSGSHHRGPALYTSFPAAYTSSASTSASHSPAYGAYPRSNPQDPYDTASPTYKLHGLAASLPPTDLGYSSARAPPYAAPYQYHHPPGPTSAPQPQPRSPYTTQPTTSNRLPPPAPISNPNYNARPVLPTLQPGVRLGPDPRHDPLRPSARMQERSPAYASAAGPSSSSTTPSSATRHWQDPAAAAAATEVRVGDEQRERRGSHAHRERDRDRNYEHREAERERDRGYDYRRPGSGAGASNGNGKSSGGSGSTRQSIALSDIMGPWRRDRERER